MQIVDELLSINAVFTTVAAVLVLAHAGALLGTVMFRAGIKPALIVNLIVAGGILLEQAPHLGPAIAFEDYRFMSLWAFELITLLANAAALCGLRVPAFVVWGQFAFNFLLSAALFGFVLTFRMTRLF